MDNITLNPSRIGQFIQRQIILNSNLIGIAMGAIFGLLLLISLLTAYFDPAGPAKYVGLYMVVFFISGYLFTNKVFAELNSGHKSYSFLTLPVSNEEKTIGSWLLTSPIFSLVYMAVVSSIFLISLLVAGKMNDMQALFNLDILKAIGVYMITQTVFFLGAVTFKNYNLLKTLFSLFLIAFGILIIGGLFTYVLFGLHGFNSGNNTNIDFKEMSDFTFLNLLPKIFWFVVGPFLILVSYFKLKERQA